MLSPQGRKISRTEVRRRVITQAKTQDDRAWLSEIASVALVQSVQDAHRLLKDNRQSFRLTRNGFSIRPNGRLYLAKVCGRVADEMPLRIRSWTCVCGARHDRDYNAARNILAAGQAERLNACGAVVRPRSREAVGAEAGSAPDMA